MIISDPVWEIVSLAENRITAYLYAQNIFVFLWYLFVKILRSLLLVDTYHLIRETLVSTSITNIPPEPLASWPGLRAVFLEP